MKKIWNFLGLSFFVAAFSLILFSCNHSIATNQSELSTNNDQKTYKHKNSSYVYNEDYMFERIKKVTKKLNYMDSKNEIYNFYKNQQLNEIITIVNNISDLFIDKNEKVEFINFILSKEERFKKSKLLAINSYFLWQLKKLKKLI